MSEAESCSKCSAASVASSAQDAHSHQSPPSTVEIQQQCQESRSHTEGIQESAQEADEFVMAVVAERARQARADLGYPSNDLGEVEGAAREAHGEAHDMCHEKPKDDDHYCKKKKAANQCAKKVVEYDVDSYSPKSKLAHTDAELACQSAQEDLEAKGKESAYTMAVIERAVSRPGAVHVTNPLGASENSWSSALAQERRQETWDEESSNNLPDVEESSDLREVSAHLVTEEEEKCGDDEAPTESMSSSCSHRTQDLGFVRRTSDLGVVLEGDNVKADTPDRPCFLYLSVAGIALLLIVVLLLVLGLVGVFQPTEEDELAAPVHHTSSPAPLSKLERIRKDGVLKCAYNRFYPSEFEQTLCKVVAAAMMGDAAEVEFVNLPLFNQRLGGLANGDIDVLIRQITHTMERDIYQASTASAFAFSTPYLYDGMKIAGDPFFVQCADNDLKHIDECWDLKICVNNESTHHRYLATVLPERNLVPLNYLYTDSQFVTNQFSKGVCNVLAEERCVLSPHNIRATGYEGNYSITERYFTKDPLSMVTSSQDQEFSDFVNAVLEALLVAEQRNITQDKAPSFPLTSVFGDAYQTMFQNAIGVAGHFGEIYDHFMAENGWEVPRDSVNMINDGTTGLIYSHPFGLIDHGREEKPLGHIMQSILDRGVLRCGVTTGRPGFAHEEAGQIAGIDVDYCRAVAAALFQGDSDKTKAEYIQLESAIDGYALLADGSVDMVAGATRNLEYDVREQTTGLGFAFSQPYFYGAEEDNLSLATRQECKDWSSFVYWIVSASFYAEENNITSALANPMPQVFVYGPAFHRMFRDSVLAVGSYSEMYERHLEPVVPRSGRNQLNANPNLGPQHYPLPGLFD